MCQDFEKLLLEAREAADLRRKETLRLVEATKAVAQRILDTARECGIYGICAEGFHVAEGKFQNPGARGWWLTYQPANEFTDRPWLDSRGVMVIAYSGDNTADVAGWDIDSPTRWLWVRLAHALLPLANAVAAASVKKAEETSTAADLAERLRAALLSTP